MKKQQSKKSGLIPKYWDLPVQTEDDLVFLGKTTIREIIREWRREAKGLAGRMKEIDEELSLLADIRENASKYSDPDFTGQKLKYDLMAGKRGPTEEKDLNRTWQSTTFNRCGWCRYAQGMRTHGVSLDPGCGINYDAGLKDEDRQFSTTCFLKGVTDELILQIRQGLQQKLVSLTGQKRAIDGKIKKLIELKAKAESKPALPAHRPIEYFKVGDEVVCYVGDRERLVADKFVSGVVFKDPDGHDHAASVRYEKRVYSGDYYGGRGWPHPRSSPWIMYPWELAYLRANPGFAKIWGIGIANARKRGFDRTRFLKDLSAV